MAKHNILNTIKNKEMDRKDFLKYSGLAIASVVGIKTIVALLANDNANIKVTRSDDKSSRGFGGGRYGS